MLLGQEVLRECTALSMRPLCCQNTVLSPVGSSWLEEMEMLDASWLWLTCPVHLQGERRRK